MILMIVLLLAAWYTTVSGVLNKATTYAESSQNAQTHEDKGMFIAAIEDYTNILALKPDDRDVLIATARDYYEIGQYKQFEDTCKSVIEKSDANQEAFDMLMNYYVEKNKISDALSYLHAVMKKYPDKEYVIDRYNSLKGAYTLKYNSYNWVSDMYKGSAACQTESLKYGAVNYNDEIKVMLDYDWAGPYDEELDGAPVKLEDVGVCYVDKKGNRLLVPNFRAEYIGILAEKVLVAEDSSGKYGYIRQDCSNATEMIYENATALVNGFGAVESNGKWAIINSSLKTSDFIYDDVIMDDNHIATKARVMWVKKDGGYQLVKRDGEVVTTSLYEDARPFASKEAAAAKKNGKWGFVDKSGNEVTEFIYEDARSFCRGFAPILDSDGLWKYIDLDGRICIDDYFTDAKCFDEKGVAFVQKESSYWVMIDLIEE